MFSQETWKKEKEIIILFLVFWWSEKFQEYSDQRGSKLENVRRVESKWIEVKAGRWRVSMKEVGSIGLNLLNEQRDLINRVTVIYQGNIV